MATHRIIAYHESEALPGRVGRTRLPGKNELLYTR
jgi:hypothetical protein